MTRERHEVLISVDGGRAELSADYMLPDGDGPFPVALSMYPYRKDDIIGSLFLAPRITLAERGIATLLVDMRGHGASSGEPGVSYDLGGLEGQDTAEVVEWAAAQPWSTGDVGIWGVSYGGMTALAAAARRPPHLRAIYAVYASDDTHRDWLAPGGNCPMALGNYSWSSHMFGLDLCPPSRQDPEGRWRRVWDERLRRMQSSPGHAFEWRKHAKDSEYWESRTVDVSTITVPTFMVEGWYDFFTDGAVRTFSLLTCQKQLVMGPWLHVPPDLVDREPYDWVGEMATWFSQHFGLPLKGEGFGDGSAVRLFVGGPQRWRRYETWPPPDAALVRWHLATDNSLSQTTTEVAGVAHHIPTLVTGLDAGMLDPLATNLGYADDQHRDDLASLWFDTPALEEPLELQGRPEAVLDIADAQTHDLRVVVKFCDVDEMGRSALLTTGWLRVSDFGPDGSAHVQVSGGPFAAVLPAGHRLRVAVSSVDFPRTWPTPGPAGFSLGIGTDQGSYVLLPVVADPRNGDKLTTEVPRPPVAPRPDWVESGEVAFRRTREAPGGAVEAVLLNHARLAPPSGARMEIDEAFTGRAASDDLKAARVCAKVRLTLELAQGEKVEVRVDTEFADSSSKATGEVVLDGKTIFEQTWSS